MITIHILKCSAFCFSFLGVVVYYTSWNKMLQKRKHLFCMRQLSCQSFGGIMFIARDYHIYHTSSIQWVKLLQHGTHFILWFFDLVHSASVCVYIRTCFTSIAAMSTPVLLPAPFQDKERWHGPNKFLQDHAHVCSFRT